MNNKKDNKTKRFPDNKYRVVHEFLYNAFRSEIRIHDNNKPREVQIDQRTKRIHKEDFKRRSSDIVHKVEILNKEIHLDNGVVFKIAIERVTGMEFLIFTDSSKVPRRIYDFDKLYTTITKEDFYALYHTLKHSFESIIFQVSI